MRPAPLRRGAAALVAAALFAACATEADPGTLDDVLGTSSTTTSTGAPSTSEPPTTSSTPEPTEPTEPPGPADDELAWGTCPDDVPEPAPRITGALECATLQVPVDPAEPDGATLDLAVARRPATGGRSRGVIVVNPGGPGGSGVDAVALDGGVVPEALRERYDVVGMDTRGSARSGTIRCVDDDEFLRYLDDVDPTPDDDGELEAYEQLVTAFETACVEANGDLLPYLGTRFVARDHEVLRRALGVRELTWFGYSYGTLVGTVYAQEFPGRVRALVLDGPVVTTVEPAAAADIDIGGLERTFRRFAAACDARDDCPLTQHGGALAALDAVIARVEEGGLEGAYQLADFTAPSGRPGEWPLGPGRIGYALIVSVYDEGSWPILEDALAAVLDDDWGGQLRLLSDIYLARFADPPEGTAAEQTFWALRCADQDTDLDVASVEEGFELEETVLGDPYEGRPTWLSGWRLPNAWCLDGVWPEPATPLGDAVVDPAVAPPALVFGGTGDFATPVEYLEPLAEAVGGGHVVRVRSNSHVNMGRNECEQRLTTAFVLDPTKEPTRTRC